MNSKIALQMKINNILRTVITKAAKEQVEEVGYWDIGWSGFGSSDSKLTDSIAAKYSIQTLNVRQLASGEDFELSMGFIGDLEKELQIAGTAGTVGLKVENGSGEDVLMLSKASTIDRVLYDVELNLSGPSDAKLLENILDALTCSSSDLI